MEYITYTHKHQQKSAREKKEFFFGSKNETKFKWI